MLLYCSLMKYMTLQEASKEYISNQEAKEDEVRRNQWVGARRRKRNAISEYMLRVAP